ncbi:helix-turn-helix domain-containing protein [Arcobacter cloacae]|uniref:Uncharacterized protein n=1 Tax=Arcobacter cloacae TaxID=1054034 RepID=A0A6M8NGN9_9BACT|nr:helix-turn-helix domain-containing protein [Arcobacter cloacae]QKF90495.1 hypothetical protein ACLO_2015 [Arcobacter cloacae]RXI37927.1 hypothetical protein CP963_11775 [Arcobacter cloacae]
MEAEIILEKLMSYFNVINYSELAQKIGVAQQNISKWKSRNSVSAIKIKCRELGIYNEIFGDLNSNTIINITSEVNQAAKEINEVDIDETTLLLFKEAYQKAKNSDNIKGLRVYLMDFQEFQKVEKITINELKDLFENMLTESKK